MGDQVPARTELADQRERGRLGNPSRQLPQGGLAEVVMFHVPIREEQRGKHNFWKGEVASPQTQK